MFHCFFLRLIWALHFLCNFYLIIRVSVLKCFAKMDIEPKVPMLSIHSDSERTIWAVGGGKGGTGKSFISSSLAIHLSSLKEDVVLIDADLGGPNLHTFLGMEEFNIDLGNFFTNKVPRLQDTISLTPFEVLKLIK